MVLVDAVLPPAGGEVAPLHGLVGLGWGAGGDDDDRRWYFGMPASDVRPGEHRDRMGEIEDFKIGQALRPQRRRIGGRDRGGIARELGGIVHDRLAARVERGFDAILLDALHHLRRFAQLGEALGMHGCAIGAAVDARGRDRAKLAIRTRQSLRSEHDAVIERRTLGERFRIMRQHQRIGADGAVRRRDFQRSELFGARRVEIDRRDPGQPLELAMDEVAHLLAHEAPRSMRRPASTRDWKFT